MLRNYHLAHELARRSAQVTCLSFADDQELASGAAGDLPPPPAEWCAEVVSIERDAAYTPAKILRGALGPTPITVLNYTTPAMSHALARLLDAQPFDAVLVETSTLGAYLPVIRAARNQPLAVCDWHNIDSELMQRYSENAANPARRLYARLTARRMAEFERNVLGDYDGHIAVSERDAGELRARAPGARVTTIENGVDVNYHTDDMLKRAYDRWPLRDQGLRRRVIFVGSMDYHANVDAVTHFAEHAWPEIHRQRPELVFTIVGRKPAPEVQELAKRPGIEVTGTVPDVRPYYHEAVAQVVSLRVGGGSRLKILEGMAAGVPVISTTLGAEGLDIADGVNIALADTPPAVAQALFTIMDNEAHNRRLVSAARDLVQRQYDWSALGEALHRTLQAWREARA
jgi:sugar transferase (PEP-CTERM/EpsH1 system associated)